MRHIKRNKRELIKRTVLIFTFLLSSILIFPDESASLLKFSDFFGALVLKYETVDEMDLSGYSNNNFNRSHFESGLQLNTTGSIYHPNLIFFRVNFNLIGFRTNNTYLSDTEINNSVNNTHDIEIQFLRKKKINFSLYSQNTFGSSDRKFSERIYTNSETYGVRLNNNTGFLPFSLNLYKSSLLSESISFQLRNETHRNAELDMKFIKTGNAKLSLHSKWRDYSEKYYDYNYQSFDVSSDFYYFYGSTKLSSIDSNLTYRKLTGDYSFEILTFKLASTNYMNNNLFSHSSYSLTKDFIGRTQLSSNLFNTSLNHRLFDSVKSKLGFSGRIEDSFTKKITSAKGDINVSYRKRIYNNQLSIGYTRSFERGDFKSKSEISEMKEEYKFSSSETITLSTPGIKIESLQITDSTLSQLYKQYIDYDLIVLDGSITIYRIIGGSIPPNSSILVYYEYLTFPDHILETNFSNFRVGIDVLNHFYVYYNNQLSKMNINSEYVITPYEEFERETFGIKLKFKILNGEYHVDNYKSPMSRYRSRYFTLYSGFRFLKYFKVSGNFNSRKSDYWSQEINSDYQSYMANFSFFPNARIRFNAIYRNIEYTTQTNFSHRESMIFKLSWQIRKILVDLFYESTLRGQAGSSRERSYFSLIIRRMF